MLYKFFDYKKGLGTSANKELAQELYKPFIKKFKRRTIYARIKGNVSVADLAETGSLSSFNRDVKYQLCVIDVFTKYARIKTLKGKKARTVPHGFIEIVRHYKRKPNKLWADQGRKFYNNATQN